MGVGGASAYAHRTPLPPHGLRSEMESPGAHMGLPLPWFKVHGEGETAGKPGHGGYEETVKKAAAFLTIRFAPCCSALRRHKLRIICFRHNVESSLAALRLLSPRDPLFWARAGAPSAAGGQFARLQGENISSTYTPRPKTYYALFAAITAKSYGVL